MHPASANVPTRSDLICRRIIDTVFILGCSTSEAVQRLSRLQENLFDQGAALEHDSEKTGWTVPFQQRTDHSTPTLNSIPNCVAMNSSSASASALAYSSRLSSVARSSRLCSSIIASIVPPSLEPWRSRV